MGNQQARRRGRGGVRGDQRQHRVGADVRPAALPRHRPRQQRAHTDPGVKETTLALQKLGQLQPFIAVFLLECMGQLACVFWANLTPFSIAGDDAPPFRA